MSEYEITPGARKDLKSIHRYIAVDNAAAADRQLEAFFTRFHRLARHPRIGQPRDDLGRGIRIFPAGSYVIVYRPRNFGIEIIQVLHGARDIAKAFRPPPATPGRSDATDN